MKKIFILFFLFISPNVFAEDFVCNTGNTVSFDRYLPSIDPSNVSAACSEIPVSNISQQRSLVISIPRKYLKISSGLATEKTTSEKAEADTAEAAALLAAQRSGAKAIVDALGSDSKVLRALLLLTLDEINDLRGWLVDFKVETAAASNLADFKARIATLPNMPDRTASAARTAIKNKIDAGDADS